MKICVTSTGPGLDSEVDPRFGRCAYFVILDSETEALQALENASSGASGGAGIQAAQTVAKAGIEVLLTGGVGPNAYSVLSDAGIEVKIGPSGTVSDAIEQYKAGKLQALRGPNSAPHTGMGGGQGSGRGQGRGQGRGR
ncbi:MAG: NifB/NifX family molybdenum-iron cluster-binding protein [Methanosarcinaceae archaeon]|nr:NifB/NifX family molybdenum-iron cluster-binding protein [Methanosarcinaceae archaeon]MDD4332233.1 NifB/NifX family molybdenum-iron cluster-binding protein [Methanosarcinaceae archaeon]MDD4749019.1 NifB/NifX family molybdenum-iron cluster-binding protein [Methanosarcinaceae archaeon]